VLSEAWHERRGAIAGTLGGDGLDAAVLLAPLVGFLHVGDERMRSTVHAIETALASDGLVQRLGLLAEMADPRSCEPLGNLPQALSHVGLVSAAQAIGDAEREPVTS
jgi:GH15 family glucan-1,4-alpha-glucosidase